MKACEALIAWTPNRDTWNRFSSIGTCKVGPLLDPYTADWTDPYAYTGGAAFIFWRKLKGAPMRARLFIEFHTLVVRDGIPLADVHREFWKIDEYRKYISPDIAPPPEAG